MSSRGKTSSSKRVVRGPARRHVRPADWIETLQRESVESAVTALINLLDAMDAASEDREADEDCCAAREDDLGRPGAVVRAGGPAGGMAETSETWIGHRVDGKGSPVVVRRRRVIAAD